MGGETDEPKLDAPAPDVDDEIAAEPAKKKAKIASGPLDPALSAAAGGEQPWAAGSKLAPKPLSSDMLDDGGDVVMTCASNASPAPAEPLPPFDLRVQLWNLQDLGGGPSRGPSRSEATIRAIAEIIHRADADVTAIIEVHRSGHAVSSNPKYPGYDRGANRFTVAGCSLLGLAMFSWANRSAIKTCLRAAIESLEPANIAWCKTPEEFKTCQEKLKEQISRFSITDDRFQFSSPRHKNFKSAAATQLNALLTALEASLRELLSAESGEPALTRSRQLGSNNPLFRSDENTPSLLGQDFNELDASRRRGGELGSWISFWEKHELLDDEPWSFFEGLAKEALEAKVLTEPQKQDIMAAGGYDKGMADGDDPEPPTAAAAPSASSDASGAPAGDTDDADSKDHRGFCEIQRIVAALNGIAKSAVYASMPTLEEVKTACPQKQVSRKRPKVNEEDHSDYYYTKGESYAFIYRCDRTRRAGEAPGTGSKTTDFTFLPGKFQQRRPAKATFVFGDAEVDFIAHHPPAEANNEDRKRLRTTEFKELATQLGEIRKQPRLCFYLADTNADTLLEKTAKIPFTDEEGPTVAEFLASLSDYPRYGAKSLFARTPTSHRRSRKTITDTVASMPEALLKRIESPVASLANTSDQPMTTDIERAVEHRRRAVVGIHTMLSAQQDPYHTRAKAFDKIAIVRGSHWTDRRREWVVPLAYAVEPPPLAYSEEPIASLFEPVPDWAWPCMSKYRYLIGRKLGAKPYEDEKIFVDLKTKKLAAEGARVEQLLRVVNLLSDHSPCVLECTVNLPKDYARTSCPGAPEPRKQGDNSTFGGHAALHAPPPADFGLTGDGHLAADGTGIEIERVVCLRQGDNSCGFRAAWNAAALFFNEASLRDFEGLYGTLGLRGGKLPVDVADDAVTHALEMLGVASHVAFLGHFQELENLADWSIHEAWTRVCQVGRREPGAFAVLVINTIGNSADVLASRRGYGHYLAVRLDVRDGGVLVTYADSLNADSANVDGRAPLLRALVEQIRLHTPLP